MTVLILEPVSLELNKIRTSHNSATEAALAPIAHRTAIHVISDAAVVRMRAPHLPKSFVGRKCFVAIKHLLYGEFHQLTHCSINFNSNNALILLGPFASDPALDNLIFQNMA